MNENVNNILVEFEKVKNYFSEISGSIYESKSDNKDIISNTTIVSGTSGLFDISTTNDKSDNIDIVGNTNVIDNINSSKEALTKLSTSLNSLTIKHFGKEYSELIASINNLITNMLQQIEYLLNTSNLITPEVVDSFSSLINSLYNIIRDLLNIYVMNYKYDKEAELLMLKHKLKKDEMLYKYKLYSNEVQSDNTEKIEYTFPIN